MGPAGRERYRRDRILFLGYRDDVPAILAASRASVVCSESEAFPYVVLESLAAGTPVQKLPGLHPDDLRAAYNLPSTSAGTRPVGFSAR